MAAEAVDGGGGGGIGGVAPVDCLFLLLFLLERNCNFLLASWALHLASFSMLVMVADWYLVCNRSSEVRQEFVVSCISLVMSSSWMVRTLVEI